MHIHAKFSGHLCAKCGGPAPGWKCEACGATSENFDSRHNLTCSKGGRMEAKCQRCGKAESACTCTV